MENDEQMALLPTGDYLRQLLGQSKVKNKEIKNILRRRGVFNINSDKEICAPILIKTGLSPYEFFELKEAYKIKEEKNKTKTRFIDWVSDNSLLEAIPEDINHESLLNDHLGTCQLIRATDFVAVDGNPNHIRMEFEISRNDKIKNWGENVSHHEGSMEIKKDPDGKKAIISLTHTSTETKDYNNKMAGHVVDYLKRKNYVREDVKVKTINFLDFSNETRIAFFSELTQMKEHQLLKFIDTKAIKFSPDNNVNSYPKNIEWMKDKIDELKIKGKSLHSTFFIQESKFHEYIQLFGLTCKYSLSVKDISGFCEILFEFSDRNELNDEAELTLNINMLKLAANDSELSRIQIEKKIFDSLEIPKLRLYEKYKI